MKKLMLFSMLMILQTGAAFSATGSGSITFVNNIIDKISAPRFTVVSFGGLCGSPSAGQCHFPFVPSNGGSSKVTVNFPVKMGYLSIYTCQKGDSCIYSLPMGTSQLPLACRQAFNVPGAYTLTMTGTMEYDSATSSDVIKNLSCARTKTL